MFPIAKIPYFHFLLDLARSISKVTHLNKKTRLQICPFRQYDNGYTTFMVFCFKHESI